MLGPIFYFTLATLLRRPPTFLGSFSILAFCYEPSISSMRSLKPAGTLDFCLRRGGSISFYPLFFTKAVKPFKKAFFVSMTVFFALNCFLIRFSILFYSLDYFSAMFLSCILSKPFCLAAMIKARVKRR